MGFGVRHVVINSTNTAALKFQPCVSTGAISDNSCKDCPFLIATVIPCDRQASGFLISYYRDKFGLLGSVVTFLSIQNLCIDFIKQPAMIVYSQMKKAVYIKCILLLLQVLMFWDKQAKILNDQAVAVMPSVSTEQ